MSSDSINPFLFFVSGKHAAMKGANRFSLSSASSTSCMVSSHSCMPSTKEVLCGFNQTTSSPLSIFFKTGNSSSNFAILYASLLNRAVHFSFLTTKKRYALPSPLRTAILKYTFAQAQCTFPTARTESHKVTLCAPDAFCEAKKIISHPCASMHEVLFMSWERAFTLQRDKVFPMT